MIDTVTTIASVPAIIALTNLMKALGLGGKWAALAALLLGLTLNIAAYVFAGSGLWEAASQGLILGLAAAGLYDLTTPATAAAREGE